MGETVAGASLIRFSVFEFDASAGELRKNGAKIKLEGQPFQVLAALLERPGQLVTRDELRQRLWSADTFVDFDHGINTAVKRLRHALDDSRATPRFIETVPRHGYRFICPLNVDDPLKPDEAEPAVEAAARDRYPVRRLAAVGVLLLATGIIIGRLMTRRADSTPLPDAIRFQASPPKGLVFGGAGTDPSAAVSPDGRRIAFLASSRADNVHRVWVQSLGSSDDAVPLEGSEGAWTPFWSVDSRRVAFTVSGRLQAMEPGASAPRALSASSTTGGLGAGAWNDRGEILAGPASGEGPLYLLTAKGGPPRSVTRLAGGEIAHLWPQFLPGGRQFLYFALAADRSRSGVYLSSLDDPRRTLILTSPFAALYANGYLLFVRGEALWAQPFDPQARRLLGDARTIAPSVGTNPANGRVAVSASENGRLVYSLAPRGPTRQLVWFDRTGLRLGEVGAPDRIAGFQLSPDDAWIAFQRTDLSVQPRAPDIWVLNLARDAPSRLTVNPANDEDPVWAPDSARLAYAQRLAIRARRVVTGDDEALFESDDGKHPTDWSRDGRFILFERADRSGRAHTWVLPLASREPYALTEGPYNQRQARFSPDGRSIAYVSDESGRWEVYLQSFPEPGTKRQVSHGGGAVPRWRRDGREVFFMSPDEKVMVAPVQPNGTLQVGTPHVLFDLERVVADPYTECGYAVARDGQRFLVAAAVPEEGGGAPVFVVANWTRLIDRPSGVPMIR